MTGAAGVSEPAGCLAGPAASWLDPPHPSRRPDIWVGEDRPPPDLSAHPPPPDTGGHPSAGLSGDTPPPLLGTSSPLGHPSYPSSHPRRLSESLHLGNSVDFIFHNIPYFSKKPLYFEKHPFSKYRKNTALRKYLFFGYL